MFKFVEHSRMFCFLFCHWLSSLSGNMLEALSSFSSKYSQLLKSQLSFISRIEASHIMVLRELPAFD